MRFWLLTSTFYGQWLPGDRRGFVGRVWERRPDDHGLSLRQEHDQPGEVYDANIAGLERASHELLRQPPITVNCEQAECLLAQFQETARCRQWSLLAVAIMFNHVHWVAGLSDSQHGSVALQAFKSYGSRVLNQRFGAQKCGTWWTSKGSTRALPNDIAVQGAVEYVLQ